MFLTFTTGEFYIPFPMRSFSFRYVIRENPSSQSRKSSACGKRHIAKFRVVRWIALHTRRKVFFFKFSNNNKIRCDVDRSINHFALVEPIKFRRRERARVHSAVSFKHVRHPYRITSCWFIILVIHTDWCKCQDHFQYTPYSLSKCSFPDAVP